RSRCGSRTTCIAARRTHCSPICASSARAITRCSGTQCISAPTACWSIIPRAAASSFQWPVDGLTRRTICSTARPRRTRPPCCCLPTGITPRRFADRFQGNGLPGANGIPDVLDEARWGLAWLLKMYPEDDLLLNQLGDDRDHTFWDLPANDSSDYGWGRGGSRPVYPCTGKPQGLFENKNRSTGLASTAGKYAAAFALGAGVFQQRDSAFASRLAQRARAVYALGAAHPGVCQTAPARSPYFYEEDDWADDMELGAVELYGLTGERTYFDAALAYAAQEPMTPWMGQDTARHYQWYPWHNNGHYEIWRLGPDSARRLMADYYRRGLEAVARRAHNGFRIGIPFIWCSNNLLASFATQAHFYRRMTGDSSYLEYETAALDWLLGVNPWG